MIIEVIVNPRLLSPFRQRLDACGAKVISEYQYQFSSDKEYVIEVDCTEQNERTVRDAAIFSWIRDRQLQQVYSSEPEFEKMALEMDQDIASGRLTYKPLR